MPRFLLPLLLAASSIEAATPAACDRSVYYILQGKYDAALQQLEGAKSSGSSPAEVENLRGLALLMSGKTTEALANFDKALQIDPALEAARLNRGMALLRQGDAARAGVEFEKLWANEHSALRALAAFHNGIVQEKVGNLEAAEMWLDRTRATDPDLDAALLYLGFLRERRGDLQAAGRAYFEYLNVNPTSTVAMLRFGLTAQKAGRTDVAKTYLQKVVTAAPASYEGLEARKFLVMWE